jgi:hypothetical protein
MKLIVNMGEVAPLEHNRTPATGWGPRHSAEQALADIIDSHRLPRGDAPP